MITDIPFDLASINYRIDSGDLVVFQKLYGRRTLSALSYLKARNIATVYIDCDLPLKLEEARCSSLVISPSNALTKLYRDNGISTAVTISEMYEASSSPTLHKHEKLRCVWFGCMDSFKLAEVGELRSLFADYLPQHELIVISNQSCDYQWSLPEAWDMIRMCDIAVLSGNGGPSSSCKSANRLVQAMALGLPTIAYPTPSYRLLVKEQRNALLCETKAQWVEALRAMEDVEYRMKLATTGFRYARRYFSPARVTTMWEHTLGNVAAGVHHP
jgi:hypothetical protein